MELILPPTKTNHFDRRMKIFLAGSIDNGQAEDWQSKAARKLEPYDVVVFNPRRDDWDWTWEQSIKNEKFYEQVTWEQEAMSCSDLIIMNLLPESKSPISLLELGFALGVGYNIMVCCPDGFWRKGNVDIMCEKGNVPVYTDLNFMVEKGILPFLPIAKQS